MLWACLVGLIHKALENPAARPLNGQWVKAVVVWAAGLGAKQGAGVSKRASERIKASGIRSGIHILTLAP